VVRKEDTKDATNIKTNDSTVEKNGFIIVSQNGSHIKLRNMDTGVQVIVPCHCKDLKKGLEQAILKQAGIWRSHE